MKEIYLDYASATPLDPAVKDAMEPYLRGEYGNPSSLHKKGTDAKNAVENARRKIAGILSCKPNEILFTGSGTESINLAIKGLAWKNKHIITTKIEHSAVIETCRSLDAEITYLDVDKYGLISLQQLKESIKKDTMLISIIYGNNEIGTVQDIPSIGGIAKKNNIIFHTDACQAPGILGIDITKLNIDMMSLNGSKIYGPKGIGILYAREGIKLRPLIHGGNQESGLRSGTENVAAIVGMAKALELALKSRNMYGALRQYFINKIKNKIPYIKVNGHPSDVLKNIISISFPGVKGEDIVMHLNEYSIYTSIGSACHSKIREASHVLQAIGLSDKEAMATVRFSIGKATTKKDLGYVAEKLNVIIESLKKAA
jgi:cysteine desulfurase